MSTTPIDRLLAYFEHPTRRGQEWAVRCPAHADARPSLNIREGGDGRPLLICRAGCSTDAILSALGTSWPALLEGVNGAARHGRGSRGRSREVCRYPYRDAHGRLLYHKVRGEPKTFYFKVAPGVKPPGPRKPDEGELAGVPRVLYRLPELLEESVIVVTEGEKDADLLASWGFAATCNDDGAAAADAREPKWKAHHTAQLLEAGARDVVIVPDADGPGQAHAAAVARLCHTAGLPVRVVALPDLPAGGKDVSDWAAAGHEADELRALIAGTPLWTPAAAASAGGADDGRGLIDDVALAGLPDPAWAVEGLLPAAGVGVIYGPSGTGKTTFVAHLSGCLATGTPFFGAAVHRQGPTAYVACEDVAGFKARLLAWKDAHGFPRDRVVGVYTRREPLNLRDPADVDDLLARVQPLGLVSLAIDTWAGATPGANENASEDMTPALAAARRLADALGALVVIVHHANASGSRERGHSSLRGGADTMIALAEVDDVIELDVTKQRNGPRARRLTLRLVPRPDGHGCTLAVAGTTGPTVDLTVNQRKALETLRESFGLEGASKTDWQRALPDMNERTFFRATKRLVDEGLVAEEQRKFVVTLRGRAETQRPDSW